MNNQHDEHNATTTNMHNELREIISFQLGIPSIDIDYTTMETIDAYIQKQLKRAELRGAEKAVQLEITNFERGQKIAVNTMMLRPDETFHAELRNPTDSVYEIKRLDNQDV